jgi:hypothetical protein
VKYDPERAAAFYDEYGEREWTRFEDGRNSGTSLEVHRHYLRRFVRPGDVVPDYGHLPMQLFRWHELQELLARHGEIVAASAAGLLKTDEPDDPALRDLLTRLELDLGAEPGAIDGGEHMLAVLRRR